MLVDKEVSCPGRPKLATGFSLSHTTASHHSCQSEYSGSEVSSNQVEKTDIFTGKSPVHSPSKYLYSDFVKSLDQSTAKLVDQVPLMNTCGKKKPACLPPPGNLT